MIKQFLALLFSVLLPFQLFAADVYYSVGQNTTSHMTGTPTMTVASGVATFSVAQTSTAMGVGDRVTFNGSSVCYVASKSATDVWNLVTKLGAACPNVTGATVNSIAHEFLSMNAAIGGSSPGAADANHLNTGDLVAGGYVLHITLYYDSGPDTSWVQVLSTTWTTGASNYIQVFTPNDTSTQCNLSQRHAGVYSAAKYRLAGNGTNGYLLSTTVPYIRFEGSQISNIQAADYGAIKQDGPIIAASDVRFTENIIYNTKGKGIETGAGTVTLENDIIYGAELAGIEVTYNAHDTATAILNCTLVGNGTYGVLRSSGGATVKNTYSGGNGTSDYSEATPTAFTTSASSDATVRAGVTASLAYDASNFANVTPGSEDLHLVPGAAAALLTGGTDLSASFTHDIDGQLRTAPWSIGADELDVGGGRKKWVVVQ
jgi:hypothetical protein